MFKSVAWIAVMALGTLGVACAPASGPTDAAAETSMSSTCAQFCACEEVTCASQVPAGMTCMDWCATFSATQRDCRTYHCGIASSPPAAENAVTHCPHTAGLNGFCM